MFVLAQLGVYAAMQVPTGLLVDRYGPRRLLIAAACTMAPAQLAFAFVQSYPAALLARAILGCGDAMTFVSVVRFAAQDFAPRRFGTVMAVRWWLRVRGLLLGAQSRGEPVSVRVVRHQFDRVLAARPGPPVRRAGGADGHNAVREPPPAAGGPVRAAHRVGSIASTRSNPLDAKKPARGLDQGTTTRRSMW